SEADVLLDELAETGHTVEQIMSGMLKLLRERENHFELEHVKSVSESSDRRDRYGKDSQSEGKRGAYNSKRSERGYDKSAKSGGASAAGGRGKRSHESGMVRLQLDLGRSNGIKPGDVVYGVASSANIP